jgi:protein-disulfide isomerase
VAKNLIKTPIQVGFKKAQLRMDGTQINPEMVPSIGNGPIEILLFTNTQCESCQGLLQTMSSFAQNNAKYFVVKYIFNFPDSNSEERMLAEASLCLRKQNDAFFWQFPSLFTKGETPIEESINNAARNSGADFEKFRSCFLAREFKAVVDAHLEGTKTLGFHKPPVAVVNGLVHEKPDAQALIEQALDVKAEKGLGFNFFYKLKKMFAGQ